jgi:hypothetical protein
VANADLFQLSDKINYSNSGELPWTLLEAFSEDASFDDCMYSAARRAFQGIDADVIF